jgi:hypothetical protein
MLPEATVRFDAAVPSLDVFEIFAVVLFVRGAAGPGGGTGSLLFDIGLGDPLIFGWRDIMAYSHSALPLISKF